MATVERDYRFVVAYDKDDTGIWTVFVFDGENEYSVSHSDVSRTWCERWASNVISLLEAGNSTVLNLG